MQAYEFRSLYKVNTKVVEKAPAPRVLLIKADKKADVNVGFAEGGENLWFNLRCQCGQKERRLPPC